MPFLFSQISWKILFYSPPPPPPFLAQNWNFLTLSSKLFSKIYNPFRFCSNMEQCKLKKVLSLISSPSVSLIDSNLIIEENTIPKNLWIQHDDFMQSATILDTGWNILIKLLSFLLRYIFTFSIQHYDLRGLKKKILKYWKVFLISSSQWYM